VLALPMYGNQEIKQFVHFYYHKDQVALSNHQLNKSNLSRALSKQQKFQPHIIIPIR
jgi:hypothetical protein